MFIVFFLKGAEPIPHKASRELMSYCPVRLTVKTEYVETGEDPD